MTDRHALPRAAGSIRLIGVKKNHRLSRWVAFFTIRTTNVANAIINDMASNGKGRYIIMDLQDYDRVTDSIKLMGALDAGRKSGEEQGWISSEQLKRELEI